MQSVALIVREEGMTKSVQTIADIARICCVSKSTVSRALNDSPLVSEETKQRIRAVAREHHFQINSAAQRLSLRKSGTIAFAVHAYKDEKQFSIADLFFLEILGAVANTLASRHYDLLLASIDPHDPEWPHDYIDTGRVDGFILWSTTRKQDHIKILAEMQVPFIIWGMPLLNYRYCSVNTDSYDGGRQATDYLYRRGRRRIAFVGGPADQIETQQRFDGFAAALRAHGAEVDPALVEKGEWTSEAGAELTGRLLKSAPDLDADFANSDLMAVGAINAIRESGRRVPEDVSVVGYDNLSIAQLTSPPLTTISQNIPLVGRLLAQNLIQSIETGIVTNVTQPAELVVRQSA
jgi:DNA-binding LacI/PurR family transcriptional regulator